MSVKTATLRSVLNEMICPSNTDILRIVLHAYSTLLNLSDFMTAMNNLLHGTDCSHPLTSVASGCHT